MERQAAEHRSGDRHRDVPEHAGRVSRHGDDQQHVGDAGQRQERRVEERDQEQTGTAERQRQGADPIDKFAHRMIG